jgi:HPr kinase/phosphorylase
VARLIEVAALVQALRKIGHDPASQFNDRLIAHMAAAQKQPPPVSTRTADEPEE